MKLLAHQGTSGGFKVFRYVDQGGRVCAFYDTALLFPTNAINAAGASLGVAVLDMSDPAHPIQTATLREMPMLTPHESLNLNVKRGLLAAVNGNPTTAPGLVSIYDVHADCRHPVLDSTSLVARFGHESGFSSDGRTFYATATALPAITAIDVTDPRQPHAIWQGNIIAHGMSLSDDGNRAYLAARDGLKILDVSNVQKRVINPAVTLVSSLSWPEKSTPQIATPVTIKGHPFLVEIDEFGSNATIGAARIIDIADEKKPVVVSNIRLEVNQPAVQAEQANDPGATTTFRGYTGHYCDVPARQDPGVLACTFILSGLRLFDIHDPYQPRELGYFNPPPRHLLPGPPTTADPVSNYAMSKPTFVPARSEIWYTDGNNGFYALKVTNGVLPATSGSSGPTVKPKVAVTATGSSLPPTNRGSLSLLAWLAAAMGSAAAVLISRRRQPST